MAPRATAEPTRADPFTLTAAIDASGALRRTTGYGRLRLRRPLGHLASIDGVRAISVAAVIAYHLDAGWATGGYLGVEVFFVVSGFLITTLILGEQRAMQGVDLRHFWLRRFRRLLPAVVAMIAVVCAFAAVVHRPDLALFRGDAVASLAYVQNWWAIVSGQSYFQEFGRPSPFRHLWSLAIEEQFYLVWPVVAVAAIRRLGPHRTLLLVVGGIAVSAGWMWVLADPAALDRAYLGTDTRAFGLLVGAAAAFLFRPGQPAHRWLAVEVGGVAAVDLAAGAALVMLLWQFATRSEFSGFTSPWGFLLVDALTLVLIAAAVSPASVLAGALGAPPLAAIGRRSYSLYLWHWPVLVFTRPHVDLGFGGAGATLVRLAISAVLAEVSYRFVENRFRGDAPRRSPLAHPVRDAARRRGLMLAAGAGALALVVAVVSAQPADPPGPERLRIEAPAPTTTVRVDPAPAGTDGGTTTTATTAPPPPPAPATVIGESVTLGAADVLQQLIPGVAIDAEVGRSFERGVRVVEDLARQGLLGDTVVVHIGNNGVAPDGALERVVDACRGHRLVLVNVRVPRRWAMQVDAAIDDVARRHPEVTVVDWAAVTEADPGLLRDDGVHLTRRGMLRYGELIEAAVEG